MATVTVRGRAYGDVEPDRVRLVIAVRSEAATGAEALSELSGRAAAADAALDGTGDLLILRRPAAVTLSPIWSEQGAVTGQQARRAVTVEARATGPLGELLAALAEVPGAAVEDTEWLVEPGNAAHGRLRGEAVADARGRAADYARAADLRLGAVELITEPEIRPGDPGWVPQAMMASGRAKMDSVGGPVLELRPEPVPVTAAVDVRYALLGP